MFLKRERKKNKHRKIALLTRRKLNSIEKISKALISSAISHEEFILLINKEENYFRLKESIRAKDDQLSNIEQGRFIEHSERFGQNKRQSVKLKTDV